MTVRIASALVALLFSHAVFAQAFPAKPITMVVGFEPGGGTDTVARIVAKGLGDNLGQQVITENRAGAGGNIAVDYVVKAAPDGLVQVLVHDNLDFPGLEGVKIDGVFDRDLVHSCRGGL